MIALIQNIELREPLWLLLSIVPVVIFLYDSAIKRIKKDDYADTHLQAWAISNNSLQRKIKIKNIFLLFASWFLLCVALAGPRLAEITYNTSNIEQNEVFLLIDLSRSMSARDTIPNRIERAKLESIDFINQSKDIRIGIVVFAGRPHLLSPPTNDKAVLKHYINTLQTDLLPTEGSNISDALNFTLKFISKDKKSSAAIVLISDGEEYYTSEQKTHIDNSLQQFKERNIRIYVLGIGTDIGKSILTKESGWLTYDNNTVESRINEENLKYIAHSTNGIYALYDDQNSDWDNLYHNGLALDNIKNNTSEDKTLIVWHELYHWFLMSGLLTLALLIVHKKPTIAVKNAVIVLAVGFYGLHVKPAHANESDLKQAYDLYTQGQYQKAKQIFAQHPGYQARIAEASSAYNIENYQNAGLLFTQAFLDANTDKQRGIALFNLANCYYQLENYAVAEQIYNDVLQYSPNLTQAKNNATYAAALKRKQEKKAAEYKRASTGTGPSSAKVEDGTDVGDARVSIDGSDDKNNTALPMLYDENDPLSVSISVDNASTATSDLETFNDTSWTYTATTAAEARRAISQLYVDESILWKRIYEAEEGFPAPVETPHALPEVKPW